MPISRFRRRMRCSGAAATAGDVLSTPIHWTCIGNLEGLKWLRRRDGIRDAFDHNLDLPLPPRYSLGLIQSFPDLFTQSCSRVLSIIETIATPKMCRSYQWNRQNKVTRRISIFPALFAGP